MIKVNSKSSLIVILSSKETISYSSPRGRNNMHRQQVQSNEIKSIFVTGFTFARDGDVIRLVTQTVCGSVYGEGKFLFFIHD